MRGFRLGIALAVAATTALAHINPAAPATASASGNAVVPCTYTGTLARADDTDAGPVTLPFTANFYGNPYTKVFVNNNGNVTFGAASDAYVPFEPSAVIPPMIAPFAADVDTRGSKSSSVHFGTTTVGGRAAFCALWGDGTRGVGYSTKHDERLNKFQLLLVDRSDRAPGEFDAIFNYDAIQWETDDHDGGVHGCGGKSAAAGFSAGDQNATHFYALLGSHIPGSFLDDPSCPAGSIAHRAQRHGLAHTYFNDPTHTDGRWIFNIKDGAPARPNIYLGGLQAVEGDSGNTTYEIPITLDAPSAAPVAFRYSLTTLRGDTANAGEDFVEVKRQTMTLAMPTRADFNGLTVTSAFIPVQIIGDKADEHNEFFTATLDSPTGARIAQGTRHITIVDDEPGPPLHVDVNRAMLYEGNQVSTVGGHNKLDFWITLSSPLAAGQTVTVQYNVVALTAKGNDVDYKVYVPVPHTVKFSAGGKRQFLVLIGVNADMCQEPNETFAVILSNPTGAALGPQPVGLGTISDDGDTRQRPPCS